MSEKEYIEREALQNKAFGENHPTFYDGQDIADWYEKCINETPAADVAPVRHGRWKQDVLRVKAALSIVAQVYICSECGKPAKMQHNFCPHCGAKMDEESEKNA